MLRTCRRCTAAKSRTASRRAFLPCVSWCAGRRPGRRGWGWGSRGCDWWSSRAPGPRRGSDLPPSSSPCTPSPSDWSPAVTHTTYSFCIDWLTDWLSEDVRSMCITRMWANAQRDGRPAEYRWRPLFNAAKFGWCPLLQCRAVTLPRRESRWNVLGCPKLVNRSQPLLSQRSPYCEDMWRRYCFSTNFSNCWYLP